MSDQQTPVTRVVTPHPAPQYDQLRAARSPWWRMPRGFYLRVDKAVQANPMVRFQRRLEQWLGIAVFGALGAVSFVVLLQCLWDRSWSDAFVLGIAMVIMMRLVRGELRQKSPRTD